MSKRTSIVYISATLIAAFLLGCETMRYDVKPKDGYVPDAETAIRIAVAIWEPIYGADEIAGEKPYRARLTNGKWIVKGSLPKGWVGGVALAEIAKKDGRVLRVEHGK